MPQVVIKPPHAFPCVKAVANTEEALVQIIGGALREVRVSREIIMYVPAEGMYNSDQPLNFWHENFPIYGTVIFARKVGIALTDIRYEDEAFVSEYLLVNQ